MEVKLKNEELKYIISRYDHYYDSVNNKSNLYLTLNTFVLGGIIAGYSTLNDKYHFGYGFHFFLFILMIIVNLLSIIFTLAAIKPYLNYRNDNPKGSIIYFGDVSNMKINSLYDKWSRIDELKFYNDLVKQQHLLAIGLNKKFKRMNASTILIIIQIFILGFFGVFFLIFK